MQQERCPAFASHGTRLHKLLHIRDAAEELVMVSDYVVGSEKSIQFDGIEMIGAGVSAHTVQDEIEVARKLFDLRIMTVLMTIFDSERMKVKDVQQYLLVFRGGLFHIDPNNVFLIF